MKFISNEIILFLHDRNLEQTGGEPGLLHGDQFSDLITQLEMFVNYTNPTILEVASWYVQRLVQNHYFVDGNKRVAFTVLTLFLELNGYKYQNNIDDQLFNFIMDIAKVEISTLSEIHSRLETLLEK